MRRTGAIGLGLAAVMLVAACGVDKGSTSDGKESVTLRFASGLSAKTSLGGAPTKALEDLQADSDGQIKFEMFQDGSLLSLPDTLAGIKDGRADLGIVNGTGHPQELPLTTVVGVPFVTTDVYAESKSLQDLYEESKIYQQEWDKQGLHVLFFAPVPSGLAGTKVPIDSPEDFDGMRLRTAGLLSDAVAPMGADPVDLPVSEVYESLQRGVIDGYAGQIFDLAANLGLFELAKYVTNLGTGVYSISVVAINKAKWDGLTDEQRDLFDKAVDHYYKDVIVPVTTQFEDAACDKAIEQNVKLSAFAPDVVEKWKGEVLPRLEAKWKKSVLDAGISEADADAFLARYRELAAQNEVGSTYKDGLTTCMSR